LKVVPTLSIGKAGALTLALAALLLASCVPLPTDPLWASVTTFGDEQDILFAFHDRVTLIDPVDGSPVRRLGTDGEPLRDEAGNPLPWTVQVPGTPPTQLYFAPIPVDDSTFILPSFSRRFYEVDVSSARIPLPEGRQMAADTETSHIVADVVATDDMIYVPLSEGDIQAIDRQSFSQVWKFDTPFGVWTQPLLVDGVLYVASMDHNLYALDAETGRRLWVVDLRGAITSTPLYYEGNLYVGSFARRLFQISTDGQVLSEFETRDWVWATPAIRDNTVYVGDAAGWLYALSIDGRDMALQWDRQVAAKTIRATPLVTDDLIVIGARDNAVYWLNRVDGSVRVRNQMIGEVLANLLLIEPSDAVRIPEPYVIVSTMARDESLVAFTLSEGVRRWVWKP
jgi:hypothetical protein